MPYELYSETLGDWPLVGYYSMAWLTVYPLLARLMPDCPAKLKVQEEKQSSEEVASPEQVRNAHLISQQNIQEVMALLNALFCTIVGAYVLLQSPYQWDVESEKNEQWVVNFSLASFMADTIWGTYHGTLAADKYAHHLGVLIGLGASTSMGMFSKECLASLIFAEFSNVFLCSRFIMEGYEMKAGTFFKLNAGVFMISFFSCRLF
jgi:hypothetical protein